MLIKTEILLPPDIYEGLKFIERSKSIPYHDLRNGTTTAGHAHRLRLGRVAHWIASHPYEYEVGRLNRSFVSET